MGETFVFDNDYIAECRDFIRNDCDDAAAGVRLSRALDEVERLRELVDADWRSYGHPLPEKGANRE